MAAVLRGGLAVVLLAAGLPSVSVAEEEAEKTPPRIALSAPLGALPGTTSRLTLRGWQLDTASQLRVAEGVATATILEKGPAQVPNRQDAKQIGDTQLVIELTLPPDSARQTVSLIVVAEERESEPYPLLVGGPFPVVVEAEPNDGFRQAQAIQIPQIIDGTIQAAQDVDVFSFEAAAGQTVICEVAAQRHGSALDSILTLYDARGTILAANDDSQGADSRLEVTLPQTGVYFLSLIDAHDLGGPAHPYRLTVKTAE